MKDEAVASGVEAAELTARPSGDPRPLPEGIVARRVVVEVPATTANLGAGYDALALALDLRDRFEVELLDEPGLELAVEGEGAGVLPAERDNRFVVALETGLRWALGQVPPGVGWHIRMLNQIPLSRGLGSSAAATVGGLIAADAFAGGRLNQRRLLTLCIELEGHPDNAAAALLGGFVVIALVEGRPETVRFDVPRDLRAVLFIPDVHLSTQAMRAALPREVPHRDAAFNVGRVALGVAGIATGRYELLRAATEDRLHEPYRAEVYPALPKLVAAAREAGAIGACLSGSGSTIVAFGDALRKLTAIESALLAVAAEADLTGVAQIVTPRNAGAVVIEAK
ncbi:MAG: homoserine kinase [Candidatus Limnocylindrales bacterium]